MEITKRELYDFKDRKFPEKICFSPIGIVHSPFKSLKGIPIQPIFSKIEARILLPKIMTGRIKPFIILPKLLYGSNNVTKNIRLKRKNITVITRNEYLR